MIDFNKIIADNKARNKELDKPYDPIFGIGSPIERFEFKIDNKVTVHLPLSMKEEEVVQTSIKAGSLLNRYNNSIAQVTKKVKQLPVKFLLEFSKIRIKHDFEYWAAITIIIKDKVSANEIWFVLNRGQRRLLARLEKMRQAGVPIRILLVKARQWGGSTLVEFYATWLQTVIRNNWNSCIVGDIERQSLTIRGMYTFAAARYPKHIGSLTMKPFEGSKDKIIEESGSIVSVGSMQKPESLRSQDIKIAHFSEVASFKKTEGKTPEDLVQSIKASVPYVADTMIVEESTAKGVGNFFHKNYKRSKDKESNYDLVFVSWSDIERNRIKINDKRAFIKTMSEYDWWMWNLGATLEGINWYNIILKTEFGGDHWRMKSENPNTAEEAFQSTGHRVFNPNIVLNARRNNTPPVAKGVLYADAKTGPDSLNNISFEPSNDGHLWIWSYPDNSITVKNRYIVSLDIGGTTKKADWSVLRVFDKYWMLDNGVPETVATIRIHIDNDILAWMGAQLSTWYNNALFVVENNKVKKYKNMEGEGFLTILNEISEYYDNLYFDKRHDVSDQAIPIKFGFHTNTATKPMFIRTLNAAMRDDGYIERDERVCDECDEFEVKPDGELAAVDGANDDMVDCTGIGLWVCLFDSEMPKEIDMKALEAKREKAKRNKRIKGAASF